MKTYRKQDKKLFKVKSAYEFFNVEFIDVLVIEQLRNNGDDRA